MKNLVFWRKMAALAVVSLAAFSTLEVGAATIYLQDFNTPGWTSNTDPGDWQGNVVQNGTVGSVTGSGQFTRFGGYSSTFGNGFTASQDFYLDPTWSIGTGFEWSVAANGSDGNHQRDFIWHVGQVNGLGLLVNASNNSNFSFNTGALTNQVGQSYFTVTTAGWYNLEQVFYEDSGLLFVDFNLYDASQTLLHTITRGGNAQDTIPGDVGGNRYGWFTYNSVNNLSIDNTMLETNAVVPVPAAAGLGFLGMGLVGFLRRRKNTAA